MIRQPADGAANTRVVGRNAVGDQTDDDLPCPVDVIHAPSTEPAEIRLLVVPDEVESPFVDVAVGTNAKSHGTLEDPSR